MRNFNESRKQWANGGTYFQNVLPETPQLDPIVRTYNSLWGTLTNTHMSRSDEGDYIITGTILGADKDWKRILYSCVWGGCRLDQFGFCSLSDMINKSGHNWEKICLNGQPAIKLIPIFDRPEEVATELAKESEGEYAKPRLIECSHFNVLSTAFPKSINLLGNADKIQECLKKDLYNAAKAMNESTDIAGTNWHVSGDTIAGLVGTEMCILNIKILQ